MQILWSISSISKNVLEIRTWRLGKSKRGHWEYLLFVHDVLQCLPTGVQNLPVTRCRAFKSLDLTLSMPRIHSLRAQQLPARKYLPIVWSEMKDTDKWQCYDHFRPFFCRMYVHFPQNWGSDSHFEVLHWSKFWLVQKFWHKTQIFPFPFFCDFVQNQTFAFFAFLRFVW